MKKGHQNIWWVKKEFCNKKCQYGTFSERCSVTEGNCFIGLGGWTPLAVHMIESRPRGISYLSEDPEPSPRSRLRLESPERWLLLTLDGLQLPTLRGKGG